MSPKFKPRPAYTVEQYATDKKLDVAFLRELGLTDDGTRVKIPYMNEAGDTVATRYRHAGGFEWEPGSKPILYGLERLNGPPVTLVEGESDAHTLAAHGYPVLALPGANNWTEEWARYFSDPFFVVIEPDQGGQALLESLRFSSVRDRANLIVMDADAKDPSDLYMADPEQFKQRWTEKIQKAVPWQDGTGWPDPMELSAKVEYPPPIPIDAYPPVLSQFINNVSGMSQTPGDMAALVVLSVAGAAVANKYVIQLRAGFHEPLNCYTCTVAASGERKSVVFSCATDVFYQYETGVVLDGKQSREKWRDEYDVLTKRLNKLMGQLSASEEALGLLGDWMAVHKAGEEWKEPKKTDEDSTDGQKIKKEIEDIRDKLAEYDERLKEPRLIASNTTPEALVVLLEANDDRMLLASPESLFDVISDPYKTALGIDVYKRAHREEPLRDDRIGRPTVVVRRPALSIAMCCQPVAIESVYSSKAGRRYEGEGVLARFMWAAPRPMVGYRATGSDVPYFNPLTVDSYNKVIRAMLRSDIPKDDNGRVCPRQLTLTDGARQVFNDWESEVENEFRFDGSLEAPLTEWGAKLVGATARIAGIFHLVSHTETIVESSSDEHQREERVMDKTEPGPVPASTMSDAVRVARSLIAHARTVFLQAREREDIRLARYVLGRILDYDGDELTVRDLWRLTHGKVQLQTVADLDKCLGVLERHHQVATVKRPTAGRPATCVFANPLLERGARSAKSPSRDG